MRMLLVLLGVVTLSGHMLGQAPAGAFKPKVFRGYEVVRVDRFAVGVWKDNAFTFIYSKEMTPEERSLFGVLPPEEAKKFQEQYERIHANQQAQSKYVTQDATRQKTDEAALVLEIAALVEEKGKDSPIPPPVTEPLGLGDKPITGKGLGYKDASGNVIRFFFVAPHSGKKVMLFSSADKGSGKAFLFLAHEDGAFSKCFFSLRGGEKEVRDPTAADKALASDIITELHGKLKRGEIPPKP